MRTLLFEEKDYIARITLNRPEVLNALNPELYEELRSLLRQIASEKNIRVVIITGAGKAFAAGADISAMVSMTPLEAKELAHRAVQATGFIQKMPQPVIAALNGLALGGGWELALTCDIRIASTKAKIGLPETNLGVIPGGGGTQRMVELVGLAKTKELIFTGRILSAEEAYALGMLNSAVDPDSLMTTVQELALTLAGRSPVALRLAKAAINKTQESVLSDGLDYEIERFADCFSHQDQKEGMRAFLEKRPANYGEMKK
ncbi:MAG: enoyl-CoA hydratase/isomerase family protein [Syntrophales bacterium]